LAFLVFLSFFAVFLSFFLPITRSSDSSFGSAHWSRPTGPQC